MRGFSLVVLGSLIAGCGPGSAQSDAPTPAIAQQLIDQKYLSDGRDIQFLATEIGAPHQASATEGMQLQVSLGQPIYPLHIAYTTVTGAGPSAYVRDYDQHYYVFRSAQKQNAWDLTENGQPEDKNGILRGG